MSSHLHFEFHRPICCEALKVCFERLHVYGVPAGEHTDHLHVWLNKYNSTIPKEVGEALLTIVRIQLPQRIAVHLHQGITHPEPWLPWLVVDGIDSHAPPRRMKIDARTHLYVCFEGKPAWCLKLLFCSASILKTFGWHRPARQCCEAFLFGELCTFFFNVFFLPLVALVLRLVLKAAATAKGEHSPFLQLGLVLPEAVVANEFVVALARIIPFSGAVLHSPRLQPTAPGLALWV
mmetsp:Transcript_111083/g.278125  ORF Transcript_111083/g.278125 Transcript_111083/m.278125 type:complete len:235 (-) Transcript_111083:782-1486(-)